MPLYFLNIHNGFGLVRDDEGVDLPDLDAARAKAVEGVRSILSDEIKSGSLDLQGRIEICDVSGTVLGELSFADAVTIAMPDRPPATGNPTR